MAPNATSFRNDLLRQFQLYLAQGAILTVFATGYVMLSARGFHSGWPLLAAGIGLALLLRHVLESRLEGGVAARTSARTSRITVRPGILSGRSESHLLLTHPVLLSRYAPSASAWALSTTRRALDMSVGSLGLVFNFPLLVVIALAIRIESPGPVIFRQVRVGMGGTAFMAYKFRTMQVRHTRGLRLATSTDPRITRVGAFLRRFKLDELPQLWNVIRGDMALVGPRPKVTVDEPMWLAYRPGIASPSALTFRNEEELLSRVPLKEIERFYRLFLRPAKAHLDAEYMSRANFVSDLVILFRTFAACVNPRLHSVAAAVDAIARYSISRDPYVDFAVPADKIIRFAESHSESELLKEVSSKVLAERC